MHMPAQQVRRTVRCVPVGKSLAHPLDVRAARAHVDLELGVLRLEPPKPLLKLFHGDAAQVLVDDPLPLLPRAQFN